MYIYIEGEELEPSFEMNSFPGLDGAEAGLAAHFTGSGIDAFRLMSRREERERERGQ